MTNEVNKEGFIHDPQIAFDPNAFEKYGIISLTVLKELFKEYPELFQKGGLRDAVWNNAIRAGLVW